MRFRSSILCFAIALSLNNVALAQTKPDSTVKTAVPASDIPIDEIRRYVQVYQAIKQAYVEPVDDRELMQSAVRGLVKSLDPHSVYFDREDAADFDERSRGNYQGIGVEVLTLEDGTLRIIAPIDGSPAKAAGVKAGDRVIAVDGKPLTANNGAEVDLRGPDGSEVVLTIVRKGQRDPIKLSVKRGVIKIASVRSRMLEPGYGMIRISSFQADTATDFEKAVQTLRNSGPLKGLVLDLRSNPGGLLNTAVQIADDLLDHGGIVSTRGRIRDSDTRYDATPGDVLEGTKIAVLADVGSASASEVLAGALRDNKRATIVGSRTFGKGSVQTLLPLDNGDSVKLTTARYYTPSGQSIQAIGIAPDMKFEPTKEGKVSGELGYSEVSLPGHIGAANRAADPVAKIVPGDLLEGDQYLTQALKVLKAQ